MDTLLIGVVFGFYVCFDVVLGFRFGLLVSDRSGFFKITIMF